MAEQFEIERTKLRASFFNMVAAGSFLIGSTALFVLLPTSLLLSWADIDLSARDLLQLLILGSLSVLSMVMAILTYAIALRLVRRLDQKPTFDEDRDD